MAYSIFDELKKTLLGQAAIQPTTDPVTGLIAPGQKPQSGLLGEGGLLFGKGATNIIQDPKFIESLGYLAAGLQGDDPFKAMQKAELIKQGQAKTKKAQALEKLLSSTELSERDKLYIAAGLTPPTGTTATAAQRNYQTYKAIMEKGSEKEKRFAKQIFVSGGAGIKSKEQFLYESSQNLLKNFTPPKELSEELKKLEVIYDKIIVSTDSANNKKPSQTILNVPENKKDLIDGQIYNVKGNPMKWNKKNNQFENDED